MGHNGKAWRARMIAEGRCSWCARQVPLETGRCCAECAQRHRDRMNAKNQATRAAGLCIRCRKTPTDGRWSCPPCRDAFNEKRRLRQLRSGKPYKRYTRKGRAKPFDPRPFPHSWHWSPSTKVAHAFSPRHRDGKHSVCGKAPMLDCVPKEARPMVNKCKICMATTSKYATWEKPRAA